MIIPAVIHVHSRYSFDSFTSPRKIVDRAVQKGIRFLCITDHDTIKGSVSAFEYARKMYGNQIKVVLGAEYKSTSGDIIGVGISSEIQTRIPEQLVDEIHKQGGVALLPHPFYHHKDIDRLASICDVIEVFNARVSSVENTAAVELANKYNKPYYCASDAHFLFDCFSCINYYRISTEEDITANSVLSNKPFEYSHAYTKKRYLHLSQMIKGFKTKNFKMIYYSFRSYMKALIVFESLGN